MRLLKANRCYMPRALIISSYSARPRTIIVIEAEVGSSVPELSITLTVCTKITKEMFSSLLSYFLRDERALITLAPRFINGNLRPTLQITSYASHTHQCHMIHTSKRKNQSSKSRLLLDNHTSCIYLV